jgi:hypothetical protein
MQSRLVAASCSGFCCADQNIFKKIKIKQKWTTTKLQCPTRWQSCRQNHHPASITFGITILLKGAVSGRQPQKQGGSYASITYFSAPTSRFGWLGSHVGVHASRMGGK